MTAPFRIEIPEALLEAIVTDVEERVLERLNNRNEPTAPEWLTVRAAANYISTSEDAIRNMIARGRLIPHQEAPGCRIYLRRSEIDDCLGKGDYVTHSHPS